MSSERATYDDHTREIERIRALIDHIHRQAETLQQVTQRLPEAEAVALGEKAEVLLQTADELLEEVGELEYKA